jgi:peptidoglycan/LPS O-acetylase OafA/YrhL
MSTAVAIHETPSGAAGAGVSHLSEVTRAPAHKELYIPVLDGVRAIAFLLVFVAHAGLYYLVPGGFGVTVFFFLSGYLITTLLRAEGERSETISLGKFYLRRAVRILPPMYLALGLAYAAGAAGLLPLRGNWLGLASVSAYFYNYADLLHMNVVLPSGTGVLWSLMVEEHFYFIFPCVFLLFIRNKVSVRKQVSILLAVCAAALVWRMVLVYHFHTTTISTVYPRWTYSASDARFDAILFGSILAIRNNFSLGDRSPRLQRNKGLFAIAGLAVILASFLIRDGGFRETTRYTLQSIALYPVFYYVVASAHAWQASWLTWKPLRFIGWISYSMYLSHYVILEILLGLYPKHWVIDAVATFALSLLYSWLVRIAVEIPSKNWRVRLERRLATS